MGKKLHSVLRRRCKLRRLKNNVRDPRKYIEVQKANELIDSIKEFIKDSKKNGNIEEFAKTAYKAKAFNILINVGLSSFLLAFVLPKLQFLFRKLTTGSNLEPGIKTQV